MPKWHIWGWHILLLFGTFCGQGDMAAVCPSLLLTDWGLGEAGPAGQGASDGWPGQTGKFASSESGFLLNYL